jgi:putative transposase
MSFRKILEHRIPDHIDPNSIFFLTLCCENREQNQLCESPNSEIILNAVKHYHEHQKWFIHVFLLMPDHCHALLSFNTTQDISNIIKAWKRYTTLKTGIQWQRNFFDHRLRKEESFEQKAEYILNNPIRMNLVSRIEDWPYWWKPERE